MNTKELITQSYALLSRCRKFRLPVSVIHTIQDPGSQIVSGWDRITSQRIPFRQFQKEEEYVLSQHLSTAHFCLG